MTVELWRGTVERLGWGGKGLSRSSDGRLILLTAPLALLPGEEVEAELVWHARHAEGVVLRWIVEHERRVPVRAEQCSAQSAANEEGGRSIAPPLLEQGTRVPVMCPYAWHCGGCSLWGVLPQVRGELKRQMAADLLRRMLPGGPDSQWLPAPPDALRQRIQLHWDGQALGYHAQRSHALVAVECCPISVPELSAAIPLLRDALGSGALPNEPARWELATGTPPGDVRASAWGKTWTIETPAVGAAARRPVVDCPDYGGKLSTPQQPMGPRPNESPVLHHFPGATLQQHPRAFFQVCPAWAWDAFSGIFASWQLRGATLFDLYGGGGFFSRVLSAQFQRFTLVEFSPLSVAGARQNLRDLNVDLHERDVALWLGTRAPGWATTADTVLLDPPRAGLHPVVSAAIAACGAGTVVLIGCDGAAFCRDVRRICEDGAWQLQQLAVIDLFPNTPQLECVGLLRRS
jgi:23S rRNA (uracil1939-C5)-methyltransferase